MLAPQHSKERKPVDDRCKEEEGQRHARSLSDSCVERKYFRQVFFLRLFLAVTVVFVAANSFAMSTSKTRSAVWSIVNFCRSIFESINLEIYQKNVSQLNHLVKLTLSSVASHCEQLGHIQRMSIHRQSHRFKSKSKWRLIELNWNANRSINRTTCKWARVERFTFGRATQRWQPSTFRRQFKSIRNY